MGLDQHNHDTLQEALNEFKFTSETYYLNCNAIFRIAFAFYCSGCISERFPLYRFAKCDVIWTIVPCTSMQTLPHTINFIFRTHTGSQAMHAYIKN